MSRSHAHGAETPATRPLTSRAKTALVVMLLPLLAATIAGGIFLWPDDRRPQTPTALSQDQPELAAADVVRAETGTCAQDPASNNCLNISIELTEGEGRGETTTLSFPPGPGQPELGKGDTVIVGRTTDTSGATSYYYSDYERRPVLGVLAAAFAILVVLVARWRGLGAIAGLLLTWAVLTQFMLPSILEGNSPVMVALAGSAAVVFLALYVAHGFRSSTTTAVIGTLVSLGITGVLAKVSVDASRLSGFSSEEATFVQTYAGTIDLQGLVLGGIILGALGVLNDVTVTQSSAVREIAAAQPGLSRVQLYKSGMAVGRDHIASTVYTLVLAYTGAALPLLILFTLANRSFGDVVGTELVAEEVIRTLVGAIGLILCVPITTGLAAIVERSRRRPEPEVSGAEPPALSDNGGEEREARPTRVGERSGEASPVDLDKLDDKLDSLLPVVDGEDATPPPPDPDNPEETSGKKRRRWRKDPDDRPFQRHMSRREKKFWDT